MQNSSLQKVWGEERRHRDNGMVCQKTMQWESKLPKREPYKGNNKNSNKDSKVVPVAKNLTYKDRYLKSKAMQN